MTMMYCTVHISHLCYLILLRHNIVIGRGRRPLFHLNNGIKDFFAPIDASCRLNSCVLHAPDGPLDPPHVAGVAQVEGARKAREAVCA